MRRTGHTDPIVDAAWELSQKLKERAENNKADALRNAAVRQARSSEVTGGWTTIRGALDKLLATLYWVAGTDPKSNVQSLARATMHGWLSGLHAELKKEGLLKYVASPEAFKEINREIYYRRTGLLAAGWVSSSGGPAAKAADIIIRYQDAFRERLNAAGARIVDALDWTMTMAHDDYLLRRGGRGVPPIADVEEAFRVWRDFVMPRLDPKTFADVAVHPPMTEAFAREQFLRDAYSALRTGVHLTEHREPGGTGPAFEGSYNIARSISQGRTLLWKDADASAEYMARYGRSRNFYSLMTHAAERAGRQSALMEMWGTNPAGNLKLVMRRIAEHFRNSDLDGVAEFQKHAGSRWGINIENVMEHLDGRASIHSNEMAAVIGRTIRQFYDVVYLGSVAFTHAGSLVATFPSEARLYGINSFKALGELMQAVTRADGLTEAERLDVLAQLGAYGEGVSRQAFDAFAHGKNIPGYVAATHNRFMQGTGLPFLFDGAKRGMREMIANKLGRELPQSFDTLAPKLQQTLRSYGITQPEWELLRSGQMTRTQNGNVYLTPTTAKSIDPASAQTYLLNRGTIAMASAPGVMDRAVNALRGDLADRLAMLYEDAADHSVVSAGVKEQAFLKGRTRPGSWQSEILAGVLQFKTWPIAAISQVLNREVYQNLSKTDAALGIGIVAALSMLGGYMRMSARDLANGDTPRVPRNIGEAGKIMLASVAQGGGLGIWGDFLFGEIARTGAGFGGTMAGPAATDLSQLYEIYNHWSQSIGTDRKGDVWPEIAGWGLRHVPFSNLFYTKGVGDYLLWWHLQEALHPGWWERSNRRMQKDQGRTHLGYRPGGPVPYLPPVFGMGSP